MTSPFRCSDSSLDRAEPMFATASTVERWLLIEQSGPFSAEAVPAGRIGPDLLQSLRRVARGARARLVIIRRPPGVPAEPGHRVFYADVRPGRESLTTSVAADDKALAGLTLESAHWSEVHEGLFLVCTHGKHDPCCAIRGRPVVAALANSLALGRVWECSHVGGDRFAGNVVALPSGLYLGRVEPEEAETVAGVVDSGRVPVHYLRGRSSLSIPVQAAQHFARTVGGYGHLDAISDLLPLDAALQGADGETWTVDLACAGKALRVLVRRTVSEEPDQLTCHVASRKFSPRFELLALESRPGH